MGDDRADAARGKALDERRELSGDGPGAGSSRSQSPSPRADLAQVTVAERVRDQRGDLPAGRDAQLDAGGVERLLELLAPRGQLIEAHVVVAAYVRRGTDDRDAVAGGHACHRKAVIEVQRAVVNAGEDVGVQVDQLAGTCFPGYFLR